VGAAFRGVSAGFGGPYSRPSIEGDKLARGRSPQRFLQAPFAPSQIGQVFIPA